MPFGRTPTSSSPFGPGPSPVVDRRFDAPYADPMLDGFGGPARPPAGPAPAGAQAGTAARSGTVTLAPASLVMPATPVGDRSTITATIVNEGDAEVAVDAIAVSNPAFAAELAGSNAIGPRGRLAVELTFAPTPPRFGPQDAVLTIDLQDGGRLTAPIAARAEMPAPHAPSAGSSTSDGHAPPRPDTLAPVWPLASPDRCTPDNHGQAFVGDLRAVRVHNPGTPGEFRDPVATTLYPRDLVEITVDLPAAMAASAFGRLEDSAGLFAMRSAERRGNALVLVAEATHVGRTFTHLTIMSGGEEVARVPYKDLTVVEALADADRVINGSQRVATTDMESALHQIRVAIDSVFSSQKKGVTQAQTKLQSHPAKPKLPWYAELFALGGEAIISTFTAGIGNRLGRALAQWSVGVRDLDLGKLPLFDFESAFGSGLKDTLKQYVRSHMLASGASAGMTVDEQWAIALFCTAQISALEDVKLDLQGEFNNGAKAYKDLEAVHPGLGLSAVEAHRHALAETAQPLMDESEQSTVREWLKSLALATHGPFGAGATADPASAGDATDGAPAPAGSNLAHDGRGQLLVHVIPGDPSAPPSLGSMAVAGIDGPAPSVLRGTVQELGLPIEVTLGTMVIRRNETGQVWIETRGNLAVLGGNLSRREQEYLFIKGTGRAHWADETEMWAGVDAGADKLLAEVLAFPVRIP